MGESCVWIPSKKVNGKEIDDNLFMDLLSIVKDREEVKQLWGMANTPEVAAALGINEFSSAVEVLDALDNPKQFLSPESYARYVEAKESLQDKTISSYSEARTLKNQLSEKYDDVLFFIDSKDDSYSISAHPVNQNSVHKYSEQERKNILHESLVNYIRALGFDITEENMKENGVFSPSSADDMAEGLKTVIKIAKGQRGRDALPEEYAHLMIAGLESHPLVQRLFNTLTDDVVKEILGEDYETYQTKYNNSKDKLAHEAAGKLLAQAIAGKADVSLSFLPDKIAKIAFERFANGDVTDVTSMIAEAGSIAQQILSDISDGTALSYFDNVKALKSSDLYDTTVGIEKLDELVSEAYRLINKKYKILASRSKSGELTAAQAKTLANLKKSVDKKKYASSCVAFLKIAASDISNLADNIDIAKLEFEEDPSPQTMKEAFRLLRTIQTTYNAYSTVVNDMALLSKKEGIKDELSEEDINDIEEYAGNLLKSMNSLLADYKELRLNSLLKFYQNIWGSDKLIENQNGKEDVDLRDILEIGKGDTSGFGRLISSMSELSDPLLGLMYRVVKQTNDARDVNIQSFKTRINAIHAKYVATTGSRDTSFMYVKDANGVPTGEIVSDRDYQKYSEERKAEIERVSNLNTSDERKKLQIQKWEKEHTEFVMLDEEKNRGERMPKKSMYPSSGYANLTAAQKEYYDAVMNVKQSLDFMLPSRYVQTHLAVQKKKDIKDIVTQSSTPVKTTKQALKKLKDSFIRSESDTAYGQLIDESGEVINTNDVKRVLLDFSGNPVDKLPVFYTSRLSDPSMLSTDFTDSLVAYSAMANNYNQMYEIVDAMELTKDLIGDREIAQKSGLAKVVEEFSFEGEKFTSEYRKPGSTSETYKKAESFLKSAIYGKLKEEEKVSVGNKTFNYGKAGDTLKWYSSLVGLGFNMFSGASNLAMGVAQTAMEATGGQYFGYKDLAKANGYYFSHLHHTVADGYKDSKEDVMSLLLDRFDALEDYYREVSDNESGKNLLKKTVGKFNPLIFNSMGEHYLHAVSTLAMLNKVKVKQGDKTISLLDAFEAADGVTPEGATIKVLAIKSGVTKEDGTPFTNNDLFKLKEQMQSVNHGMHGAFADIDRGDANKHVLGRLLLQFRQWMPAFYARRFQLQYYNTALGENREGMYITALKFLKGSVKDIKDHKFNLSTQFKQLSQAEQANLRMASFEVLLFTALSLLLKYGGEPDKDEEGWLTAALNGAKLTGYRLKTELGAAMPFNLGFYQNVTTLVRTPVPAMENSDRLLSLLNIANMFDEIESGKYQGWTKYERDLYYAIPFAKNVGRVFDLKDGDVSMFNAYKGQQFKQK